MPGVTKVAKIFYYEDGTPVWTTGVIVARHRSNCFIVYNGGSHQYTSLIRARNYIIYFATVYGDSASVAIED